MIDWSAGAGVDRTTYFVEVILPLAIQRTYTYRVPRDQEQLIEPGRRVIVQFGKNRIYSALIYKVTQRAPERYEAKYIIDVMDDKPILTSAQFKLWEWMASYYMCSLGEVM
ncbi:MAG TPA: primosomal protein N', partial [Sphingobacteriaceae bacterium]|nr:primosomal protein N' [Sphingobacteriaceae bacterium]